MGYVPRWRNKVHGALVPWKHGLERSQREAQVVIVSEHGKAELVNRVIGRPCTMGRGKHAPVALASHGTTMLLPEFLIGWIASVDPLRAVTRASAQTLHFVRKE